MSEVVPSAVLTAAAGRRPRTGAKYLAALVEMAGILDTTASDVYVWTLDGRRLRAVHALLRAAAVVFALPAERLGAEAEQTIAAVESLRRKDGRQSFLSVLPNVDAGEIDWRRARDAKIGTDVLEGLVHHRSIWVQHLAAALLDERLDGVERLKACERLLADGTGNTLYLGSALVMGCGDVLGGELLLNRLGGRAVAGLHHLFDRLRSRGWRAKSAHLNVLENGLLRADAETALSAARCCEDSASGDDRWLVPLLRSAMSHWQEHEEPYPKGVGTVPHSPREALLRTVCRIDPPAFRELVELAADSRRDVAEAAIGQIVEFAAGSADQRSRLVDAVAQKRFSAKQCEELLGSKVPYEREELLALCGLSEDEDPAYRSVALRCVLGHARMEGEKAREVAESMRGDDDGNVRDAVYRFLDRGVQRRREDE